MLNCVIDGVNIFYPLQNKLDGLIEYFVKFYGEEYREKINRRLKNAIYFFLGEEDAILGHSTKDDVSDYYTKKLKNLKRQFYMDLGWNGKPLFNVDVDLQKTYNFIIDFKNKNITQRKYSIKTLYNVFLFSNVFGLIKDVEIKSKVDKLSCVFKILNNDASYNILKEGLQKAYLKWKFEYEKPYFKILSEKNEKNSLFEKLEKKSLEISAGYEKEIEDLFINYFSKITGENVENLKNNNEIYGYVDTFIDIIEKRTEFLTEYDRENRIKFFKFLGYDCGEIYENYLFNDSLRNIIYNKKLINSYWDLKDNYILDKCYFSPYLEDAFKDLLDKNIDPVESNVVIDFFEYVGVNDGNLAWTIPIIKKDFKEPFCICTCKQYLILDTQTLIHEQIHMVETDIFFKDSKYVGYKIGFENFNGKGVKRIKECTILNEVITDYFACKIYEQCKKDSFEVGYAPYQSSAYSRCFGLLKNFIEENLELIKKCKMSTEPNSFQKAIGKENFKRLADVVNECYQLESEEIKKAATEIKQKGINSDCLSEKAIILAKCMKNMNEIRQNVRNRLSNKTLAKPVKLCIDKELIK